jgi:hypothetical protein
MSGAFKQTVSGAQIVIAGEIRVHHARPAKVGNAEPHGPSQTAARA